MAQENNLIALKIAQVRARVRQSQSERERAKHASAESFVLCSPSPMSLVLTMCREQRRDFYSPTKALPSHPYLKTQTLAPAADPPSRPPSAHPLSLSPLPHPAPSASHSMARAYADMQASRLGAGVKDEDVQMGDS